MQLQQVRNPVLNLLHAPPGSVSRLRILQSRDERSSGYGVHAGWRHREPTTGLSETVHPPAIVSDVEINRCKDTLLELAADSGCKKHLSRFSPKRRLEPLCQYTDELLFDGATPFTPPMDGGTPHGSRRCAKVDPEVATVPMILA